MLMLKKYSVVKICSTIVSSGFYVISKEFKSAKREHF